MLTATKEGVSCDMQAKTIEAKAGSVADNDHELATRMGGRVREKRNDRPASFCVVTWRHRLENRG